MNLADRLLALEQWASQMEVRAALLVAEMRAMEAVRRHLLHELGPAIALMAPKPEPMPEGATFQSRVPAESFAMSKAQAALERKAPFSRVGLCGKRYSGQPHVVCELLEGHWGDHYASAVGRSGSGRRLGESCQHVTEVW